MFLRDRHSRITASLCMFAVGIGLMIFFAEELLNFGGQLYLGWGSFFIIFLMSKVKHFRNQPWRSLFIVLALFVSCRYMAWRIFDTLTYTGFFDFIGTALLFLAETYGFTLFLLDMFVNFSPMASEIVPLFKDESNYPSVDVFIPTYDEAESIVRMTVTAATQIQYPKEKLQIYILDDGGTHAKRRSKDSGAKAWRRHYSLRKLAKELGVNYITRDTNQKAKAGNINHALQHSNGDLVLILDCDQVPTSDILRNTVGQFVSDPKMFLVQTPHFFINETPVNNVITGISNRPDESEMFYRKIQPAMNFWNAAFFCGSAAVLRRKYLMEVGGIALKSITEDCETSLILHAHGYNSSYINKPMICGLSPETPSDYLTQHSRWAKGMLQILMHYNPLFMRGLSLPQRLAYFSSSYSWLFGFARYIFFLAPSAFLILGLNVYAANWHEMVDFTVPYALSILVVISYFFAGSRQLFFSEIYETVKGFRMIRELMPVLLNPWKQKFLVTPKGLTLEKEQLSWDAFPLFVLVTINAISIGIAAVRWYYEPIWHDNIIITAVWCCINIWLGLMSLGAFWEKRQIRAYYRIGGGGTITINRPGAAPISAELEDVSASGLGFALPLDTQLVVGEQLVMNTQDSYGNHYAFEAKVVRLQKEANHYFCGTQFIAKQVASPEAIAFVYGDSGRWQRIWDASAELKQSKLQLYLLTKLGLRAVRENSAGYFAYIAKSIGTFVVMLFNPYFWFYAITGAINWIIYLFYLFVVYTIGLVDKQHARTFPRLQAGEKMTVYFPKLDATLEGWLFDISLTGVGIRVNLPFLIDDNEMIEVFVSGITQAQHRMDCIIRRVIKDGDEVILGAEFIVDNSNFFKVVSFVYGQGSKMVFSLAVQNLKRILSYLFLVGELAEERKSLMPSPNKPSK
ncbi:UDP-forming cellulose synthase catalytic subunit [Polynucleobacter sp. AP-Capit-er-40B-B4]|uniref:UDP-forming cellulose synthase catalytic subunit n=1 Tax=Polynucleobacter sp. AP-Capit-er-40B-B4 TaxID=2576927 RepID=UPI001C0DB118|nr:UDP-forming cellulose synthase catalytic subunit [Polynucleobacter sp. AP-Capit-er-40B-B4]MBU3582273.1 UDP-forming cellulose synthase catalytic subunit [Polynucleobacter sp. AP-Capit-er-40B-B4]